MRYLYIVVFGLLLAGCASVGGLVPTQPAPSEVPEWVVQARAGKTAWASADTIFGVGVSRIRNQGLARDAVGNRARGEIMKHLRLTEACMRLSRVREFHQAEDGIWALVWVLRQNVSPTCGP